MTDDKKLIERLKTAAKPSEFRRRNPTLSDTALALRHTFEGSLFLEAAARIEALTATQGEVVAWCQPLSQGERTARKFLVTYEDSEMGVAVFDDEADAREHWTKANDRGWNCYLFGALPLHPPCTHPAPDRGELVEALRCALDEWESHNGRLADPGGPHWSNIARRELTKYGGDRG